MTATTTKMLTVLVADDSAVYRTGMARAVGSHPELALVAEAGDGAAALAAIDELRPDIALLDVRMPTLDGLQVCEAVRALEPPASTCVVLLTSHLTDDVAQGARRAGADAWLSKAIARAEICSVAIRIARSQ